ncbi:MAG: alpha/beta fold hydrolase, partial [Rhodoluna sp.]
MQKHLITLSDSRTLEVYSAGTPSAQALVFHHGTPGSALSWQRWFAAVDQLGAFAISYSRPGYGESTRKKSRTVISNTQDISEMLKHFGIQKYVAIGWSGGGPHALADTTLDSCLAAITLAGVGAFGASDLDFLEGMGQENYDEFNAALNGESKLDEWMQENSESMAEVTGPQLIEALGGLIGEADKRALDPEAAEKMAREFRHSLINGYTGWMDDDFAFIQDWGFEIGSIN